MKTLEQKWQKIWDDEDAFAVSNDSQKPKYYMLEMLPYPSGKIHVGHVRNYAIGDVVARFMKAQGYNVLHPMGWDAFGLPAENAAISNGSYPEDWTYANIAHMREQLKSLGFSYDWSREITTCDPEYYKHEQKFFLELLQKNLAYQKESLVNWDPVDNTVLANEQVVDGRGWRSNAVVEKRYLKQWFLKITDYAEELLSEIPHLTSWPDSVRSMQEKWIGKSIGVNFAFKIKGHEPHLVEVFSTKPETLYGTNFVGVAFNHPIINELVEKTNSVTAFIEKCSHLQTTDKVAPEGVFTGLHVVHPFDPDIALPIIITNFVLMDYATGAVFGCPAHDERDHALAVGMGLDIKQVVQKDGVKIEIEKTPYLGDGVMINSGVLNGLSNIEAKQRAIQELEKRSLGNTTTQYKLKDWGISRQRFWGCPIPIIYCQICGVVPVPLEDLPVTLPKNIKLDGYGNPLAHHPTWKYVSCPKCHGSAIRETDTFDTFFESSWYFTRYCAPKADNMTDKQACDYWLPVDQYVGGIEHAVMHLLYARFFTKVMNEQGYISIREPFTGLFTQGMVLHATYKDGDGHWLYPHEVLKRSGTFIHKITGLEITQGRVEKMSKSKKNLIDVEAILGSYGADALRLFVLSDSPPEKDLEWSTSGIEGCMKFINRLVKMMEVIATHQPTHSTESGMALQTIIHSTIKNVSESIKAFHLNTAIAKMRELFNHLSNELTKESANHSLIKEGYQVLVRLLNPFIPHITEEIWSKIGNSTRLYQVEFPLYNEELLQEDSYIIAVQVNGKLRDTCKFAISADESTIKNATLELPKIQKLLAGKAIKKIILIPRKIINIVV